MSLEAKRKTLEELAAAHVAFKETVSHIPDDKVTAPMQGEWSAKDLVAHVSSWEEVTALDVHRRLIRGHLPVIAALDHSEVDDWNAFLMRGRKAFSWQQVAWELEGNYEMLVEALEMAPASAFDQGSLLANFLAIAIHHYGDHGGQIHEWRQREGI
jgi:hypothetical protein